MEAAPGTGARAASDAPWASRGAARLDGAAASETGAATSSAAPAWRRSCGVWIGSTDELAVPLVFDSDGRTE